MDRPRFCRSLVIPQKCCGRLRFSQGELHATLTMEGAKDKSGVIYLSRIPTKMTVSVLRDILSRYGDVGRIFLRPDETSKKKKRDFSEGWVEFVRKADAKVVADTLNNQPVATKRRSAWCDELWNIKYLTGFCWTMLHERLAYERETYSSRMRVETAQAKREADIFKRHVRASARVLSEKGESTVASGATGSGEASNEQRKSGAATSEAEAFQLSRKRERAFRQRRTDDEIVAEKRQRDAGNPMRLEQERRRKAASNEDFLKTIFT